MCTYFKCARISKQKLRTIHCGKKYWGTGLVSEKYGGTLVSEKNRIFVYAELNETLEVILQPTNFYDIFILCLWQGV